jgi:hypothetical protein
MLVNVDEFTAMKGHVSDGCVIIGRLGERFTLKNTIKGWRVLDDKGNEISGNLPSAFDVEFFVINGRIGRA